MHYALCLSRPKSSATIKQHINTQVVHLLIAVAPKQVLVPLCAHDFIVDARPSFLNSAVSIPVEHIDHIVPVACALAVVVKHLMALVVRWLRRFPRYGCYNFWIGT